MCFFFKWSFKRTFNINLSKGLSTQKEFQTEFQKYFFQMDFQNEFLSKGISNGFSKGFSKGLSKRRRHARTHDPHARTHLRVATHWSRVASGTHAHTPTHAQTVFTKQMPFLVTILVQNNKQHKKWKAISFSRETKTLLINDYMKNDFNKYSRRFFIAGTPIGE